MLGIGIIEGFFGPEWSWQARHRFCENLSFYGGNFYIYAPKRDSYLRKSWTLKHPVQVWNELKSLSLKCRDKNIAFGVGLSPFELHSNWNLESKKRLRDKILWLEELELSYLGIFFDDMRGSPDLADKQLEILDFVKSVTPKKILFCPTYYSPDPILDKVFGDRPPGYLEKIGTLPQDIEIFWTGNKVIPKEITCTELQAVAKILKRKPFLWENYFANDGPKQCKFLKLKPFGGRSQANLASSSGWAFNLMNQPRLSEIVFAASVQVLRHDANPAEALEVELSKGEGSEILKKYKTDFIELGLDQMMPSLKKKLQGLANATGPLEEVRDWVNGKYLVGDECLTD